MCNRFKSIVWGLAMALVVSLPVAAQPPRIDNGSVKSQPAGSPFSASFRALVESQTDIAWIGYSVPVVDRERMMCCFNDGNTFVNGSGSGCCSACRLENSSGTNITSRDTTRAVSAGTVKLEGSDRMSVLFRVADRKVERVRVFSEDCRLDAGGRPVHWLENVRPSDSIALLESLSTTDGDGKGRISDGAIAAIALHADLSADAAL